MTVARSFRRTVGIASIAALLSAGLIAPPAQGVATPSSFVFNCDNALAVGTTNLTANIGDTFTIRNTGGARSCVIRSFSSFLSLTNMAGNNLPTGGTSTATVNGGGTFTVQSLAGGPLQTINVLLPFPTANYTMTFDANGGACRSSTSYSLSGDSGAAYPLPSAQDCVRPGYTLLGWAFDSNATVPANDNNTPGATVHFADNDTMYAVWTLGAAFNLITYNVNVLSEDCYRSPEGFETKTPDLSGIIHDANQVARTYEQITGVNAQLHFFPSCYPISANDEPDRFLGWNTLVSGTGTMYYAPSPKILNRAFSLDEGAQGVTLYAQWTGPCPTVDGIGLVVPGPEAGKDWRGCDLSEADLSGVDMSGATLIGADLEGTDLTGANLRSANLTDAILTGADLSYANQDGTKFHNTIMPDGSIKSSAT
ncbi:MAG: pentapeptide repeat-containing protein [Candidatus Nanopelagicales bacterium]|nr:pentapeptide repeat-containing protein [Candidatus Nanopelagicales bacterium]